MSNMQDVVIIWMWQEVIKTLISCILSNMADLAGSIGKVENRVNDQSNYP